MELSQNESSLISRYEDHETRITALEKAVVDLHHDIALLRQHMDCGFEALHAEIAHMADKLRLEFQESQQQFYEKILLELRGIDERGMQRTDRLEERIDRLEERIDRLEERIARLEQRIERLEQRIDRLEERIDRIEAKLDHFIKWIIGMQLTTMGGLIALAAHQYL